MKRCENKDVNSLKDIGKEAMEERQSEITEMGERNPNWVRACIVESYVSAKIFGKPKSGIDEVILEIVTWIEGNAPKAYKKHFNNRSLGINLEVMFLNKKQLKKLNRKERQDYLSTKKEMIDLQNERRR